MDEREENLRICIKNRKKTYCDGQWPYVVPKTFKEVGWETDLPMGFDQDSLMSFLLMEALKEKYYNRKRKAFVFKSKKYNSNKGLIAYDELIIKVYEKEEPDLDYYYVDDPSWDSDRCDMWDYVRGDKNET